MWKFRLDYIFHGFEGIALDDVGLYFASEPALLWRRDMNFGRQVCRLKSERTGLTAVRQPEQDIELNSCCIACTHRVYAQATKRHVRPRSMNISDHDSGPRCLSELDTMSFTTPLYPRFFFS